MSLGFAIGFAIAELKNIDDRIWILLAILIFSYILYVLLEFFLSRFGKQCCKREEEAFVANEDATEIMLDGAGGSNTHAHNASKKQSTETENRGFMLANTDDS